MALDERKLAFIGAGHITNVIVDNLVRAEKVYTHRLIASDPDKNTLQQLYDKYEIVMAEDNLDAVDRGDFIFVNVLPQVVGDVIDELRGKRLPDNKVIITLAAGIPISTYEHLGESLPVVRALPNPPSQVGKGIAVLAFNPHVTEIQKHDVFEL
ncbi:MAG: NAD(P)-binding domain-containing protein, partial [Deltaproteobacteria bacterium]|nr:NAD(P)-binding domain-containing protein [Deltaproteobacteria bacterium]